MLVERSLPLISVPQSQSDTNGDPIVPADIAPARVAADKVAFTGLLPDVQYCVVVPADAIVLVLARCQVQFPENFGVI